MGLLRLEREGEREEDRANEFDISGEMPPREIQTFVGAERIGGKAAKKKKDRGGKKKESTAGEIYKDEEE